jgi:hypothetical protein
LATAFDGFRREADPGQSLAWEYRISMMTWIIPMHRQTTYISID